MRSILDLWPKFEVSASISILGFTAIFCLTEEKYTVIKHVPYFPRKKHLMADLRDVILSILVAWSHESSLS